MINRLNRSVWKSSFTFPHSSPPLTKHIFIWKYFFVRNMRQLRWNRHCTAIIMMAAPKATIYNPAPAAIPTPEVAHTPAAVVSPCISCLRYMMMPAPRKPMPETICAATREASASILSPKPYFDTTMINAEPTQTTVCVRMPASLNLSLRS